MTNPEAGDGDCVNLLHVPNAQQVPGTRQALDKHPGNQWTAPLHPHTQALGLPDTVLEMSKALTPQFQV